VAAAVSSVVAIVGLASLISIIALWRRHKIKREIIIVPAVPALDSQLH